MPTLAQKARVAEVNQYFLNTYPPGTDPKKVGSDLRQRFNMDPAEWYRTRERLKTLEWPNRPTVVPSEPAPEPLDMLPEEIVIPANLATEAREAFSRLLNRQSQLSSENAALTAENGHLRSAVIVLEKRHRQLKDITKLALENA